MPTYDYKCSACGHAFEELQSFSDPPLTKCPKCKKKKLDAAFRRRRCDPLQGRRASTRPTIAAPGRPTATARPRKRKGRERRHREKRDEERNENRSQDRDKDGIEVRDEIGRQKWREEGEVRLELGVPPALGESSNNRKMLPDEARWSECFEIGCAAGKTLRSKETRSRMRARRVKPVVGEIPEVWVSPNR